MIGGGQFTHTNADIFQIQNGTFRILKCSQRQNGSRFHTGFSRYCPRNVRGQTNGGYLQFPLFALQRGTQKYIRDNFGENSMKTHLRMQSNLGDTSLSASFCTFLFMFYFKIILAPTGLWSIFPTVFIIIAAAVHHGQRSFCVYVCLMDAWFERAGPMTNAEQNKTRCLHSTSYINIMPWILTSLFCSNLPHTGWEIWLLLLLHTSFKNDSEFVWLRK